MATPVPSRVCQHCGEYLPHACAPRVTVRDYSSRYHRPRRSVEITDVPSGVTVYGDRGRWRDLQETGQSCG